MAAKIPNFKLSDGTTIPSIGMGCWMGGPGGGQRVHDMCVNAIKHGYRHFDTASGYANEKEVGNAIRESGISRSELYITTKLGNSAHHKVQEAFDASLKNLDCEYVDLWLMHWPQATMTKEDSFTDDSVTVCLEPEESPTIIDVWKDMEKVFASGKIRTLGVSNFSIKTLEQLLPHCTVLPAVNQVELHPCLPQNDLKEYCESKGILLTAYSPLGRPSPAAAALFEDEALKKIASSQSATVAQVLLAWGIQRGTVVVPKSEDEGRMITNISLITLSETEMNEIDALHKKPGMHRSLLGFHAADGSVFGWSYEKLGWKMKVGGVVDDRA